MAHHFQHLQLTRPLCVLDCETTGTSPQHDRIIEVAVVKFKPEGRPSRFVRRVDPGVPISAAATSVHGLTDQDVAGCPPFAAIAPGLARFLQGADLAGYNIARFDLPLLLAEYRRADLELTLTDRSVIDVQRLYHRLEPRDLAAAVRHYLGHDHQDAHRAVADARATAAVLDRMLARYSDLPRTVAELHACLTETDLAGRLRREDGRLLLGFGKYAGCPLGEVAHHDPGYLAWLLGQEFLPDFKEVVARALAEVAG